MRGLRRLLRTRGMMKRLAEQRQINAFIVYRRVFDIAEPILKVLVSMFARKVSAEFDHLLRVVDGDDPFRISRQQLRNRSFARPEIRNDQSRHQT